MTDNFSSEVKFSGSGRHTTLAKNTFSTADVTKDNDTLEQMIRHKQAALQFKNNTISRTHLIWRNIVRVHI